MKIHRMTGKGEASLPRSFPSDHRAALPAASTAREGNSFQKPKTLHQNHRNRVPCSRSPHRKRCLHSPHRRCDRLRKQSADCRRPASYLWSLLWPSDHRDPSDGQTGVVIRMFLQDILWPNKGAILAQGGGGGGDLWRGLEARPNPAMKLSTLHEVNPGHHPPHTRQYHH